MNKLSTRFPEPEQTENDNQLEIRGVKIIKWILYADDVDLRAKELSKC